MHCLPCRDSEKIYVQANTIEFRERHNYEYLGKEAHITAVLTEVYNREKVIIKPHEIVLFDDDRDNVDTALKFGHWAFQIKEDVSYQTFEEYSQMLALQDKPPGAKGKTKQERFERFCSVGLGTLLYCFRVFDIILLLILYSLFALVVICYHGYRLSI